MEFLNYSIGKTLHNRSMKTPDNKAVIEGSNSYTWREVEVLAYYIAQNMKKKGIKCGDFVGLMGDNSFSWIVYYFAIIKVGAVPVLINIRFIGEEIEHCLDISNAKALYYINRNDEKLKVLSSISHIKKRDIVVVDEIEDWHDVYKDSEKTYKVEIADVDVNDVATVVFTSGTTGRSKGVGLSHHNLLNNAQGIVNCLEWQENDVMCMTVPLFHTFGVTACMLSMLLAGGSLAISESTRTLDICKNIEEHRCSIMNGVPSMFLAMKRNKDREKYDISSLKTGIIAGSQIFPQDYKEIMSMFENIKLQPSYGQSETSPCVTLARLDDDINLKANTVGKVIDGVTVRICKKDSITPCGFNVEGEVQVKGYNVMKGYVSDKESTDKTMTQDCWLKTGDLGYIREDKNLVITGRIKNLIIRGGENISPTEIENEIKKIVGNREVKVLGIPTLVLQEEIVACIEAKENEFDQDSIIKELKNKISDYKIPKHIFFMEEMPKNSTGKINDTMIRNRVVAELKGI